jgi:hypothetical protein
VVISRASLPVSVGQKNTPEIESRTDHAHRQSHRFYGYRSRLFRFLDVSAPAGEYRQSWEQEVELKVETSEREGNKCHGAPSTMIGISGWAGGIRSFGRGYFGSMIPFRSRLRSMGNG